MGCLFSGSLVLTSVCLHAFTFACTQHRTFIHIHTVYLHVIPHVPITHSISTSRRSHTNASRIYRAREGERRQGDKRVQVPVRNTTKRNTTAVASMPVSRALHCSYTRLLDTLCLSCSEAHTGGGQILFFFEEDGTTFLHPSQVG